MQHDTNNSYHDNYNYDRVSPISNKPRIKPQSKYARNVMMNITAKDNPIFTNPEYNLDT